MRKLFLILILSSLFVLVSNRAKAQNYDDKRFIQFVFTNLETREQVVEIDQFIRAQEGVFVSRADLNSKKYLLIYYSDSNIDLSLLTTWMEQLGKEFKCVLEGVHGVDAIVDQNINCDQ